MRRARGAFVGAMALASFTACGGKTEDTTPRDDSGDASCDALALEADLGSGPLGALLDAASACDEVATTAETDIAREVGELASIFRISPRPAEAEVTVDDLVTGIEAYFATVTEGGVTLTVSALTCRQNDVVTRTTEEKCRARAACDGPGSDCSASDLCNEAARLSGIASPSCAGPVIDATFTFAPTATAFDQAETYNRVSELKSRGATILGSYAQLSAVVQGDANGIVFFDPSPLVQITDEFKAFATGDVSGLGLRPGCLPYALPKVTEHVALLNGVATGSVSTLEDGKHFSTLF